MGKLIGEGITFDDVLLVPAFSEVIANDVDTRTRLTNKIQLNIPLMSASMDTVTEHRLLVQIPIRSVSIPKVQANIPQLRSGYMLL